MPAKSQDVLDGIAFWFTQENNTDPELLLLIEAVSKENVKSWRYTLARLYCLPMQIDHERTRVADLSNPFSKSEKSDPYHVWHPTLQRMGFRITRVAVFSTDSTAGERMDFGSIQAAMRELLPSVRRSSASYATVRSDFTDA